ncbi:juvenile hormone acid O-methyltransferase-like isoform X1 [Ptychodera flava]|uniref:juvenile hormone acid O-methyltransferase-like isoform X1 n=1 Tax=Ptychodera flava TaxID=63121 RepID=UPI003969BCBD
MNDTNWAWYANHREFQHTAGLKLLSLWRDDWENGDVVLDIGCGTGELTKTIAQRDNVKTVVGIDISANAIKFASKNNSVDGKTKYLVGDSMLLPETFSHFENTFTKVYCMAALHWMEDKQKVFQNARWCLKENGSFLVHVLRSENALTDVYYKSAELPKWMKYLKDFQPTFFPLVGTLESLQDLISQSGYKKYPYTIEPYSYSISANTKDKYTAFLKPLLTHLDFIPADLHDEFLEDCFQMFGRGSTNSEDSVFSWVFNGFDVKLIK